MILIMKYNDLNHYKQQLSWLTCYKYVIVIRCYFQAKSTNKDRLSVFMHTKEQDQTKKDRNWILVE